MSTCPSDLAPHANNAKPVEPALSTPASSSTPAAAKISTAHHLIRPNLVPEFTGGQNLLAQFDLFDDYQSLCQEIQESSAVKPGEKPKKKSRKSFKAYIEHLPGELPSSRFLGGGKGELQHLFAQGDFQEGPPLRQFDAGTLASAFTLQEGGLQEYLRRLEAQAAESESGKKKKKKHKDKDKHKDKSKKHKSKEDVSKADGEKKDKKKRKHREKGEADEDRERHKKKKKKKDKEKDKDKKKDKKERRREQQAAPSVQTPERPPQQAFPVPSAGRRLPDQGPGRPVQGTAVRAK